MLKIKQPPPYVTTNRILEKNTFPSEGNVWCTYVPSDLIKATFECPGKWAGWWAGDVKASMLKDGWYSDRDQQMLFVGEWEDDVWRVARWDIWRGYYGAKERLLAECRRIFGVDEVLTFEIPASQLKEIPGAKKSQS